MPQRRHPYYRRPKRKYTRKPRKARGRTRRNASTVAFSPGRSLIIPDRSFVTLKYFKTEQYSASPTGGNVYKANSLYDPEAALGGQQPVGFDQYAQFYSRYRVYGCKITVTFIPDDLDSEPLNCCVIPLDTATRPASFREAVQNPFCKSLVLFAKTPQRNRLSSYMSSCKIAGEPKRKIQMDDVYSAGTNGDPSFLWYYHTVIEAVDGSSLVDGHINVTLTYFCEFYKRIPLAQS